MSQHQKRLECLKAGYQKPSIAKIEAREEYNAGSVRSHICHQEGGE